MADSFLLHKRDKQAIIDAAVKHVCPERIETFKLLGAVPVMDRREGCYFWDMDGRKLFDVHINGGVYNLGHRNQEVIETLKEAVDHFDIGNHHMVSSARTRLAEELIRLVPGEMQYCVFTPGGSEAVEVTIRSARKATGRRKIVSFEGAYHGHGGLTLQAGYADQAAYFLSDQPDTEFIQIPFNNLPAVEQALKNGDVAAMLCEMIPATLGFPLPADGFYVEVKKLCQQHGTCFIADEVQTGLGRTGKFWACEGYHVEPDMLITGKGLTGGIYPIAAAIMSSNAAGWIREDGWGYSSTTGGSELGCIVALKVLEIIERPGVLENVQVVAEFLSQKLNELKQRHSFLIDIRQNGLIVGLQFDDPNGAMLMTAYSYESGLWAFPAGFDRSVLQFKLNILVSKKECQEALQLFENALTALENDIFKSKG